jgi:uncharacterized protein YndB with AHSA1/START domain
LTTPADAAELTIARFIQAPPAKVWKAWSTPEHLAKWWIPAPIECHGEFRPHVEACFLEVVPEARLIFTTTLTEGWRPAEPWLALTAIITFSAEGSGTRYAAHVLHRNAADARKHEEMGFQEGWGTTIDQLAAFVSRLS